MTYFDKALEREVHYNSLMDKAQILMKLEKENEAIVLIDKAIKLEPQMAMPHFFKGKKIFLSIK